MSGLEIESTGSLLTSYNGDTIDNTMWDANYNGELMNIETIHNDDYTNIQMDNNDISRLFNNIGLMNDSSIENRLQNDYNKQIEPKQEPKHEPKFIVIEPNYHMKNKSSLKNKKSSLKNKKSSLKNKKSSLKNKKSSLKNKKSSLKNKKSSLKNKKSSLKNKKSSTRKNIKLNSSDILNTIY